MDLFPRSFSEGFEARITGPGKGRFVLQPLVAIALGTLDGIADAKQGKPPYYIRILFTSEPTLDLLKTSLKRIGTPLALGIVLDMILQWVIFQSVLLLPAILAGAILVALPYSLARGLSNRVTRRWYDRRAKSEAATHTAAGS